MHRNIPARMGEETRAKATVQKLLKNFDEASSTICLCSTFLGEMEVPENERCCLHLPSSVQDRPGINVAEGKRAS